MAAFSRNICLSQTINLRGVMEGFLLTASCLEAGIKSNRACPVLCVLQKEPPHAQHQRAPQSYRWPPRSELNKGAVLYQRSLPH